MAVAPKISVNLLLPPFLRTMLQQCSAKTGCSQAELAEHALFDWAKKHGFEFATESNLYASFRTSQLDATLVSFPVKGLVHGKDKVG